jgi:hypothetical protein
MQQVRAVQVRDRHVRARCHAFGPVSREECLVPAGSIVGARRVGGERRCSGRRLLWLAGVYRVLVGRFFERGAENIAAQLTGPNGHVEFIGETSDGMHIARVVRADPHFVKQLPPDWRP